MADMLYLLEEFIHERKAKPKEGSYTNSLFEAGVN
nr:phosphoribosyl-ATP diphosphatase [Anaerolineae bacterium]